MWLPPGGHVEPHEIPDAAAVREVFEETGVCIRLVGERQITQAIGEPMLLVRPEGIQLETIQPDHQHIDLIYFATIQGDTGTDIMETHEVERAGWYRLSELESMGVNAEVREWAENASRTLRERLPESTMEGP